MPKFVYLNTVYSNIHVIMYICTLYFNIPFICICVLFILTSWEVKILEVEVKPLMEEHLYVIPKKSNGNS